MAAFPPMATELRTQRLVLGTWHDTDLDDYEKMVHERDRRAASAPRDGNPSRDALREGILRQQATTTDSGIGLLVVRVAGRFAGYSGLVAGDASLEEPEIAFELLSEFHGQGLATEAGAAIVKAARATGRRRLWATVRPWNEKSFRVLDKLGFEQTARVTTDALGETSWLSAKL